MGQLLPVASWPWAGQRKAHRWRQVSWYMLEAVREVFPEVKCQRCTVHFCRNVVSVVPRSKVKLVAKMLKAIQAQENKKAAREKARAVVADLKN